MQHARLPVRQVGQPLTASGGGSAAAGGTVRTAPLAHFCALLLASQELSSGQASPQLSEVVNVRLDHVA
eukprot:14454025-Alexandrium_andersonii.AAC.1